MFQPFPAKVVRHPTKVRWLSGMLLVVYGLVCFGVPLPNWEPLAIDAKPYPCQGHRCGCRNAEQCWKSCCCMTAQQKLAWAKARGISPPDHVVAAAQTTEKQVARSCCNRKTKLQVATCVATTTTSNRTTSVAKQQKSSPRLDWVSYVEADNCRGGGASQWLCVPASLPIQVPSVIWGELAQHDFGRVISQTLPLNPAYPPPAPPPRIA
jgi:hypothetical protein